MLSIMASPAASAETDLANLVLEIDGQVKPFDEWTLEFANRYYPDLDKKVYHIPEVPFFKSSTKVEEWSHVTEGKRWSDRGNREDSPTQNSSTEDIPSPSATSQDTTSSGRRCSAETEGERFARQMKFLDEAEMRAKGYSDLEINAKIGADYESMKSAVPSIFDIFNPDVDVRPVQHMPYYVVHDTESVTENSTLQNSSETRQKNENWQGSKGSRIQKPENQRDRQDIQHRELRKFGPDGKQERQGRNKTTNKPEMWQRECKHFGPGSKQESQDGEETPGRSDMSLSECGKFGPVVKQAVPDEEKSRNKLGMWHRECRHFGPDGTWETDNGKEVSRSSSMQEMNKRHDDQTVHTVQIQKDSSRPRHRTEKPIYQQNDNLERGNITGVKAEKAVQVALQQLGKKLGSMVAIYNYDFPNYLKKLQEQTGYRKPDRSEVDAMVVTLQSGPVMFQVKNAKCEENRSYKKNRANVMNLLKEAHRQNHKCEEIYRKIMGSDPPEVQKIIAVPFLSRQELDKFLNVLPRPDVACATFLCEDGLQDMGKWWEDNIICTPDTLSLRTMQSIVGRFVGLLSTVEVPSLDKKRVEVRTYLQAVDEVDRQISSIILTKQQAEILQCRDRVVELVGPAGSGKTLMLAIKAMMWLEQGHVVYLRKSDDQGFESARGEMLLTIIEDLCRHRNIPLAGRLRVLTAVPDFLGGTLALLLEGLNRKHVHFIFDEIHHKYNTSFTVQYITSLMREDLSVWYSLPCLDKHTRVPGITSFTLNTVLRCPPRIQKLLQDLDGELVSQWKECYVLSGEDRGMTTDGPPIKIIQHSKHILHSKRTPSECPECALSVMEVCESLGLPPSCPVDYELERKQMRNDLRKSASSFRFRVRVPKDSETCKTPVLILDFSEHSCKDGESVSEEAKQTAPTFDGDSSEYASENMMFLLQSSLGHRVFMLAHQKGSAESLMKLVLEHGAMYGSMRASNMVHQPWQKETINCVPSWCEIPFAICPAAQHAKNISTLEGVIPVTDEKLAWGLERKVVIYIMNEGAKATEESPRESEERHADDDVVGGVDDVVGGVEEVDEVPRTLLDKLEPYQRGLLFIAASRCTSQLVLIFP